MVKTYNPILHRNKRIIINIKKVIDTIINLIKNSTINNKNKKHRKHTPLSPNNNINYDESKLDNEGLKIKIGNAKEIKLFKNNYKKNNPISFSLTEKTLEEHKTYILKKLDELKNHSELNLKIYPPTLLPNNFSDEFYIDCTNDFISNSNRLMYDNAYILNIYPQFAFCQKKDKNIKLALSYIIAIKNRTLNIFFTSDKKFTRYEIEIHPNFLEKICEFNLSNKLIKNTNLDILYYNVLNFKEISLQIGYDIYHNKIIKLDEVHEIYKNNKYLNRGFLPFSSIINSANFQLTTKESKILSYSVEKHEIKNEKNKKLLKFNTKIVNL